MQLLTLAGGFTLAAAVDEAALVFLVLLRLSLRALRWTHKSLVSTGTLSSFTLALLLSAR